jgi:hypothetical protein|tara:strand:+ start:899 stop:1024 length:126 start_codon:yes stop_codon:yes gene_type:complete
VYNDRETVLEAKEDYEAGDISAWEFYQILDGWDGDPIEMIG